MMPFKWQYLGFSNSGTCFVIWQRVTSRGTPSPLTVTNLQAIIDPCKLPLNMPLCVYRAHVYATWPIDHCLYHSVRCRHRFINKSPMCTESRCKCIHSIGSLLIETDKNDMKIHGGRNGKGRRETFPLLTWLMMGPGSIPPRSNLHSHGKRFLV